jgi:periplasmic mercuric ion binding protein
MKTLKIFLIVLFAGGLSFTTSAQTNYHGNMNIAQTSAKTESFKVFGACGMCKTRIEKSVKEEGATSASWDSKTQMLMVTFDPSKTSKDAMSKKLASVGHDTEKYKAPDDVYAKLPGCCHYERSK